MSGFVGFLSYYDKPWAELSAREQLGVIQRLFFQMLSHYGQYPAMKMYRQDEERYPGERRSLGIKLQEMTDEMLAQAFRDGGLAVVSVWREDDNSPRRE